MIKIIAGNKGSGKTKRLIDMTNDTAKTASGNVVFLDKDNSYMYEIDRAVRFVNVNDYRVASAEMFLGFLCGLCASDFDLEYVFVDRFENVIRADLNDLGSFFGQLEALADKHSLHIILSVSKGQEVLPDFMKPYILE